MNNSKLLREFILFTFAICAASSERAQAEQPCEPLSVAGVSVICVDHAVGSFSPKERVAAVRERITKLAADPSFDPKLISFVEREHATDLLSPQGAIITIFDEDAANQPGVTRATLADTTRERIRTAIDAERALRSPRELLYGVAYSLISTLCVVLFFLALKRIYALIYRKVDELSSRYIKSLHLQTFELINAERVNGALLALIRLSRLFISLLAAYVYIPLVLSFFPWTANLAPRLLHYVLDPLATIFTRFLEFIPNLFYIAVIVLVTRYLLKLVKFFFAEVERGNLKFEGFYHEWAEPTYKLVRVLIIAFAFVSAFPYLPGSSSPAFQGISVFFGLLLSLGSSSAIANIVSGVVITYMRPFRVGDRVKIADTVGDVLEKNLLITRILTTKNVATTIPNSMVLGSHIVNYSATASDRGLILNTSVTIGYDTPWRKVHELLKQAALRTEHVIQENPPFVLQTALNDFYVAYELNAYTREPNRMAEIYSKLHQHIQDCFNEAGLEIMSPHYRAVRSGDEPVLDANFAAETSGPKRE